MAEFICGFFACAFIFVAWKMGYPAIRDEMSIGKEDKVDALAKSVGKKVETVPKHYEVKSI